MKDSLGEKEVLLPCPEFHEDDFFEVIKHILIEHCGDIMIGEIAEKVAERANKTLRLRLKLAQPPPAAVKWPEQLSCPYHNYLTSKVNCSTCKECRVYNTCLEECKKALESQIALRGMDIGFLLDR
jgi:hypothetical protein